MKTILESNSISENETKLFARRFCKEFLSTQNCFVVFLEGDLGSGKTTFVRECLHYFGVSSAIASPTFTYVNEYSVDNGSYAHFDFYRFTNPSEFFARGFEEIADDETVSCFVEWPGMISETAQKSFCGRKYRVNISQKDGTREILITQE